MFAAEQNIGLNMGAGKGIECANRPTPDLIIRMILARGVVFSVTYS